MNEKKDIEVHYTRWFNEGKEGDRKTDKIKCFWGYCARYIYKEKEKLV